MFSFIRRHLDPVDRLGEVLFGLIMALGVTGAVRLEDQEASNRALFLGVFGCNLAWAIVDGTMFVLAEMFERGRMARLTREVFDAPSDEAALRQIAKEVRGPLMERTTPEERGQVQRLILTVLRRDASMTLGLHRDDLLGGAAVALVIVLTTFPVVVPYLLVSNPNVAARLSNLIALTLLFLLGARWGQLVGGRPVRTALGLTVLGLVLVLVTIALGG